MNKILTVCAFAGYAYAQGPVSVEAFDEQMNNPSQMTLRLKLTNNTNQALNDVSVRYYLPLDKSQKLSVTPYYMEGATTSIDTIGDFLAVNVNVPKLAPGIFPNNGGISIGMNYSNYSSFGKTAHYSYPNSGSFISTNSMPVYVNGTKISGEAPVSEAVVDDNVKLRFVGLQPEATKSVSAWVELENYGSAEIALNDLLLKWSREDSANVGIISLASGKKLRICQSSTLECPSSDANIVISDLKFGLSGEFELLNQNQKIDYVAWGKKGSLNPSASYLKTEQNTGYGMQVSYKTGNFFRYAENVGWSLYQAAEINKSAEALPDPIPFGIDDGMSLSSDENGSVKLSWVPVKGAKAYNVSIYDSDDKLVYEKETETSFVNVKLESGEYHWNVASVNANGLVETTLGNRTLYLANLHELDSYWSEGWILGVEPIGARKDTKMLVTAWGNLAEAKGWNRVHSLEEEMTDEESWRCWAVGVNMLNRYFGGSLTQDEIKMHAFRAGQPANLSHHFDFMLGSMGGGDEKLDDAAFNYAFNTVPQIHAGAPTFSVVKEALLNGSPLFVSIRNSTGSQHVMIIDGYGVVNSDLGVGSQKIFSRGDVLYHFLNLDNNASSYWIKSNSFDFVNYRVVEKPTFVRNRDYRVANDADDDGIVDYDEQVRFSFANGLGLNKDHFDSDNDGVTDYQEFLLSSKAYNPCGVEDVLTSEDLKNFNACYDELHAAFDVDGDNRENYMDPDSDNGGERDGDEIRNGRNPFDKNDDQPTYDPSIVFDLPDDVTIYSIDEMRVNDRTICYDGEGYCKIASESGRTDFSVNVGVQSVVGDIYSKGTVWLRTRSVVNGDIHLYVPSGTEHGVRGAGIYVDYKGTTTLHDFNEWTFKPWRPEIDFTSLGELEGELVVTAGQQKTLSAGDSYARVKVESGATLNIGSGRMIAGTIQLDAGSVINFTNPGEETQLYTRGRVLWRTKIANEDQELVARGFKLVQTGDKDTFIEGDWAGTIFAPKSDLVMGQTKKIMYGRFLGKGVTMHQNSLIYRVDFDPIDPYSTVVMK